MYNNILVPVLFDDEAKAQAAIALAHTLAGDTGRITILHVMEDVPGYAMRYMSDDFMKTARMAIEGQLADMAATTPNARGVLIHGHSGRSILEYVEEHDNDLIVVSSHRPGMQDLLLGSTATQLVRHAPCAVHVMR